MTRQTKTNNLNYYLIDPTFSKLIDYLSYHLKMETIEYLLVNIIQLQNFNILIGGKSFFDVAVKNKEETYKRSIEMGRNSDYTTGNLL